MKGRSVFQIVACLLGLLATCWATPPKYLDLSITNTIRVDENDGVAVLLYKSNTPTGVTWNFHFSTDTAKCSAGLHTIQVTMTGTDPRESTDFRCGDNHEQWPDPADVEISEDDFFNYTYSYGPDSPTLRARCGCQNPPCAKAALIWAWGDSEDGCEYDLTVTATPFCQNGGKLFEEYKGTTRQNRACICPDGWSGELCETPVSAARAVGLSLDRPNTVTVAAGETVNAVLAFPANKIDFEQTLSGSGNCGSVKAVYYRTCKPARGAPDYCPATPPSPADLEGETTAWKEWTDPQFPTYFVGRVFGDDVTKAAEGEPGFYPYYQRRWDFKECCLEWGGSGLAWVRWVLILHNNATSGNCEVTLQPKIKKMGCLDYCDYFDTGVCAQRSTDTSSFEKAALNSTVGRLDDLVACQCDAGYGGATCRASTGTTELIRGTVGEFTIMDGEPLEITAAISPSNSYARVNMYWWAPTEIWLLETVTEHVILIRANAPAAFEKDIIFTDDGAVSITPTPILAVDVTGVKPDGLTGTETEDGYIIGAPILVRIPPRFSGYIEINIIGEGDLTGSERINGTVGYDIGIKDGVTVVNLHMDLEESVLLHFSVLDSGNYRRGYLGSRSDIYQHYPRAQLELEDPLGATIGGIGLAVVIVGILVGLPLCGKNLRQKIKEGNTAADSDKGGIELSSIGKKVRDLIVGATDNSGSADDDDDSTCCACLNEEGAGKKILKWVLIVLAMLLVLFIMIFITVFIVLFNIGLMHSSLSSMLTLDAVEDLNEKIKDALSSMALPFMTDVFSGLRKYFGWLDFVTSIGLQWNCGGALTMMAPVAFAAGGALLAVLVNGDIILVSTVLKSQAKNQSGVRAQVLSKLSNGVATVTLMAIQSAIVALSQVTSSVWGIERNCSDFDQWIVGFGRAMCVVVIIIFLYVAVRLFANVKGWDPCEWLKGVGRLIAMSLGVWTDTTSSHFEVSSKAGDYNAEDQEMLTLIAKTRGLMWMPVPFGVMLTKFCEAANNPPLIVAGDLTVKEGGVKRAGKWLLSVVKFALTVVPVISSTVQNIAVAVAGAVVIDILLALEEAVPMLRGAAATAQASLPK